MMIRSFLLFLIFTAPGFAQTWEVTRTEKITRSEDGLCFYPQFSAEGSKIVCTTAKYKGLYAIDLKTRQKETLTESTGAGYKPVFSLDGEKVYFRKDSYPNRKKQSSLIELDLKTKEEVILRTGQDKISQLNLFDDHVLVYKSQIGLKRIELNTEIAKSSVRAQQPVLYTEDRSMILDQNGTKKVLTPLGEGYYIWASVSADQQMILFTLAGRGSYISDFEGKILYELGNAHAPQWSPDGQWIVYMDDRDDGHAYTGSEIFITSLNGKKRFQVTENGLIAMYPAWSPDGRMITFHSYEGEIYLLQLSYAPDGD